MIEAINEAYTNILGWIGELINAFPDLKDVSGWAILGAVLLILAFILNRNTK